MEGQTFFLLVERAALLGVTLAGARRLWLTVVLASLALPEAAAVGVTPKHRVAGSLGLSYT